MEQGRVVEVFAPAATGGRDGFGSGYLVSETLVLTAGHVIDGASGNCKVRPLGEEGWLEAESVWRGEDCDAALLRVPAQDSIWPARFGRPAGPERVPCQSLGFPLAQAEGKKRDTEEISGKIALLTGLKSGRLTVHIDGAVPLADGSGHSLWEGMSGAALFAGSRVVGIVCVAPAHFGTDRLEAASVAVCAEEPRFREVFQRESGHEFALEAEAGLPDLLPAETKVANFLQQYLGDDERPVPFAGRDAELAYLDAWLEDPGRPYLLIAGLPGRGKSALLARWWDRCRGRDAAELSRSVFVPVSIRYDLNRETDVLSAAVARLEGSGGDRITGAALTGQESAANLKDRLGAILSHPPAAGKTTLLILDGLDEAAGWTPGPAFFPKLPAAGIKVVVSARLTASHSRVEDWLNDLGWDDGNAATLTVDVLSLDGTREVIESIGPALAPLAGEPEVVEQLHSVSAGDPLVLALYLRHLSKHGGGDPRAAVDSLRAGKPGLAGFMELWWRDQESLWGAGIAESKPAVATVLDLLACAIGPLERTDLLTLVRHKVDVTGDGLDEAIRVLDRMVVRESPASYALSHPRLAEHRLERLAADDELGEYESFFADWGRATLSDLREGRLSPSDLSSYLVRHYRGHLDRTRGGRGSHPAAAPERYLELVDPAWLGAWEAVADEPSGYIDDVEMARHVIEVADAASIARGEGASFAAEEIWCSYIRAEHASALELIGGELAGSLLEYGIWTEGRALSACAEIDESWPRAKALVALVPYLGVPGLRRVTGLLPAEAQEEEVFFGEAVAKVAHGLACRGDLSEARAFAESQGPGDARAFAILGLLPAAPERERPALLGLARDDLVGRPLRDELLESLTRTVDLDLAREVLSDDPIGLVIDQLKRDPQSWPRGSALEDLEGPKRAYALSYIAPWLSASELEAEVGATLAGIERAQGIYGIGDAMQSLAPYLRGDLLRQAINDVNKLLADDPSFLVTALVELLEAPENPWRERLVGRVVPHLEEFVGSGITGDVSRALATLARHGAAADCLRVVTELDESSWAKADFLEALAPQLEPAMVRQKLLASFQIRHETRGDAVKALLARLASFGPDEAREALRLASANEEPDEMSAAAAALSHAGAAPLRLDELLAIEDGSLRLAALAAASRSAALSAAVFRDALLSFGPDRAEPFEFLALELFDEMRRSLPDEEVQAEAAVGALGQIVWRGAHPRKDEFVLGYLRQLVGAIGPSATVALGERLSCPVPAILAAAECARDESEVAALRQFAAGFDGIGAVAVEAALLPSVPAGRRDAACAALIDRLSPAEVELRPHPAALVFRALPDEYRERAVRRLVPDELLDGTSGNAPGGATWGDHMADLAPVLELDQVRRLRDAASMARSGSTGSRIRAAAAARIGKLGHLEEAIDGLGLVSEARYAAAALCELTGLAGAGDVPRLIEVAMERFRLPSHRNERARVWAVATRRLPELSPDQQWSLLRAWLGRKPSQGEVLVDLLLLSPIVAALGGLDAAEDLSLRLDPVRRLSTQVRAAS